jgi:CheY-like chemotaxis protein
VKILIADDDAVCRGLLHATLVARGFEVTAASDGAEAWEKLQVEEAPSLVVLDWMMPRMDGVVLCRKLRAEARQRPLYVILLTSNSSKEDISRGLDAGADDYIIKPFDRQELLARVQVGIRVLLLQRSLADRVLELEAALSRVKQLQGLLPMCCYCKNIRDDNNYWQQLEHYLAANSNAQLSHGICPSCFEKVVEPQLRGCSKRGQTRAKFEGV